LPTGLVLTHTQDRKSPRRQGVTQEHRRKYTKTDWGCISLAPSRLPAPDFPERPRQWSFECQVQSPRSKVRDGIERTLDFGPWTVSPGQFVRRRPVQSGQRYIE